jgi:inorganic pyrophosphatase
MGLDRVPSGKSLPNDFNVIIEIPMHADPVKYEVDKESGAVFVDRFMSTAMHYPCNYGYIPHTIAGDGDPVDVLVITQFALPPGVVVRCRPIGLLAMEDEAGPDGKLLAVPVDSLTPMYRDIESPRDFPRSCLIRSPTSLPTTRISNAASSSRSPAGWAATRRRRKSWKACSASMMPKTSRPSERFLSASR